MVLLVLHGNESAHYFWSFLTHLLDVILGATCHQDTLNEIPGIVSRRLAGTKEQNFQTE